MPRPDHRMAFSRGIKPLPQSAAELMTSPPEVTGDIRVNSRG